MRRLLKFFGYTALVILALHASPLIALAGGVVLGRMAVRDFNGLRDRLSGVFGSGNSVLSRDRGQSKKNEVKNDLQKEYVKGKGWNLLAFPKDMRAELDSRYANEAMFTVAGMKNAVHGKARNNGTVDYTFSTSSLEEARRGQEKLKMFNGTVKMEQRGSEYLFTSTKASAINEFVKAAYPPKKLTVERTDTDVKEYLLYGCKSAEEAMDKLRSNPEAYNPSNSYTKISTEIEGKKDLHVIGEPLSLDSLPLGAFILSVESSEVLKGGVVVSGRLDSEAAFNAAQMSFAEGLSEDNSRSVSGKQVFDLTPEGIARFAFDERNDNMLEVFTEKSAAEQLSREGFKAYVVCDSVEEAAGLVADGEFKKDALVIIDKDAPNLNPGQFAVAVDVDSDVLARLGIQGEASPSFAANFTSYGLNARDLEVSTLMDNLAGNGYATLRVKDGIDISKGKVNGVSVDEFAGRVVDGRMMGLKGEQMSQWLQDAAMIQSVTVSIDKKNAELQITSVVNNTQLIERRKLSDKELMDFARRGEVSKAEMKDLLIQMHPEFFKTYSLNGKGLMKDPVSDFLKGQKPKLNTELSQAMKQQQAKVKVQNQAPSMTPKTHKKNQMKLS